MTILPILYLMLALQSAPNTTATVEGLVVKQGSTDPVQGVTVGMIPEGRGRATGPRARTDEAGKFRFTNIIPGRYELFAEPGVRRSLNLSAGQTLKDVRLHLLQPLTLTGRVLDESGAPVRGAWVMATQPTYIIPAGRVLRPCQAAANARVETDEQGQYRLFGLEPGSYYVSVAQKGPVVIGVLGTPMPESSCITLFYPSATDPAEAVPVVLKPGSDATGIDLRLRKPPLYVAKFKVVLAPRATPSPVPPQITIARLSRNGIRATLQQGAVGTFGDNGTYTSPGLPEGSYELEYSKGRGIAIDTARIRFTIVDRDVDAGMMMMYPAVSVSGEVKTEGPMPAEWDLSKLTVGLRPIDVRDYVAIRTFPVSGGKFSTGETVGQGRYQFYFAGLHESLYLATATRNGQDILDGGLAIEGAEPAVVALTLRQGGQVEGIVRNARDEPVSDSMVALIPAPNLRGNLLLFKSITSDQDGRFSFRGVAPGDYTVLAWENAEANAARNPEFLKEFETRGVRITIREGATSTANSRLIPATP